MNSLQDPFISQSVLVYVLFFWSLFWKGLALWKASKCNQRNWFMVLLILNTLGVLEIIYLFRFAKVRMKIKDLKNGFKDIFFEKSSKTKA